MAENQTFKEKKNILEKHLRFLIDQPFREFQNKEGIVIKGIAIDILDVSSNTKQRTTIGKIHITI